MGTMTGRGLSRFRGATSALALTVALLLAGAVGGCGLMAEQGGPAPAEGSVSTGASPSSSQDTSTSAPASPPTPTPTPTPGEGPACPVLRCTSVLVTGDMLVHAQLWQQAQQDAAARASPDWSSGRF